MEGPMTQQSDFFEADAARRIVRPRVAGIIIRDAQLLVQRPADDPASCYAFIGGEYEVGDTFVSRLRAEIEEETNARLVHAEYLFVVENRFVVDGVLIHGVEHYLLAEIDRYRIQSHESHLSFHWLPIDYLAKYDLRPHVAREAIANGDYNRIKHLVVPL